MLALLISGCSVQEHKIIIAANPDICAGVVQVDLTIKGASEEIDLHHTYAMDPGAATCSFAPDLEIETMPPGDERQVFIEGRDSAGQLVIQGYSASFDVPPPEQSVVVPVDRTDLPPGTALFSVPEAWTKEADLLHLSLSKTAPGPKIYFNTPESRAWGQYQGQPRFSITGMPEETLLHLYFHKRNDGYDTANCIIGQVFPGEIFLKEDPRFSPGECVVLAP